MAVDTLKFADELIDGGLQESQAKAIVNGMSEHVLPELATKSDIRGIEYMLTELKLSLTVRFYAGLAGAVGLTVTLIKLI